MPRLRDYKAFDEPGPSLEIDITGGGGAYLPQPETVTDEEGAQIEQLMRGKPPLGFGDEPWRKEMAGLEEESAAIRGETEEILTGIRGKYTPEQISAAKERLAARRRPPEGFQVPEFSDAGRERYEQGIFREIQNRFRIPGGNPFKINPMDAVEEAVGATLPKLFEHIFGGHILWADRDRLESDEVKIWSRAVKDYRASVYKKAEIALDRAEAYHTYAMSKYDTQRKAYEGRKEQIEKDRLRQRMTAPQRRVNDKGELTWHEWDETLQKWEDTGKLVKEEKEKKPTPPTKITKEKFALQKAISASTYRTALTGDERDTTVFQANAPLYNKTNQRNEVAYWQTLGREKTKIVKIPIENIKDGWTPEKLQEAAYAKGITIEQVLGELGIIKLPIELMKPLSVRLPIPQE